LYENKLYADWNLSSVSLCRLCELCVKILLVVNGY